jgi:Holliday junction resolvase RusA-like endonuclease
MKKIVIEGELTSHNSYTDAIRRNRYKGGSIKRMNERLCEHWIRSARYEGFMLERFPVDITLTWFCKNKRTDPDNISSAIKFILDSMQKVGVIDNDSWKTIGSITHHFRVDADRPRIELEFKEPEKTQSRKKQTYVNDQNHSQTRKHVNQKRKDTKKVQKYGKNATL